jgi:hypothetical protein
MVCFYAGADQHTFVQLPGSPVQPVPLQMTASAQLRLCMLQQLLWLHHRAFKLPAFQRGCTWLQLQPWQLQEAPTHPPGPIIIL